MSMSENESNLLEYYERTVKECMEECDGNCIMYSEGNCECVDANVLDHLRELQQYRAIGTIEELKDLKEKSVAKKFMWHKDMNGIGRMSCPSCLKVVPHNDYCCNCGQAIDWSEG